MIYVGIEVADVSFAAGSLARIVLCFGSWRQQRLRGFQQESAILFRNGDGRCRFEEPVDGLSYLLITDVDVSITVERCVDDVDFTVREEDATSFELVAMPRIDVAAGSSRGRGSLIVENTSTVAPTSLVGGNAILLVAAVKVSWRVAHYHTVNTPRGHYSLLMILGAMFEFFSSLEGRAFR
ncbi:hypothetical protein F511_20040 [Dorcoceras hygrometricum]|uniref:Uncharacterized protein n=1 Tax=Dorcoceras hygrometricum TaxID=472368 RepID=A0A2Z7CB76_9LAMI|nr:hypothetical protein F511_20040 [Dorcoceras hygrometricum]